MSDLMDYGPDWPPALPAPAVTTPTKRRRWPLWKRCIAWTLVYATFAIVGMVALHVFGPAPLTWYGPPAPMPHPATVHSHP